MLADMMKMMSPYLRAHAAYHRDGAPWIPWVDALDFHLQHGVVVSNGRTFLMARRVVSAWADHHHLSLRAVDAHEVPDGWHVWSAAGGLEELLEIARRHPAAEITFQRRNERLHRVRAERLLKRVFQQLAGHQTPNVTPGEDSPRSRERRGAGWMARRLPPPSSRPPADG